MYLDIPDKLWTLTNIKVDKAFQTFGRGQDGAVS
jgi:hypothetical protein